MEAVKRPVRSVSVELARLIACFIVIGVHINLSDTPNNIYLLSRGYINCFLADGVAVFWMITGFFIFNNTNYKNLLKRALLHILLPAFVLSVFVILVLPFLMGPYHYGKLPSIWSGNFSPESSLKTLTHLWYCGAYFLVALIYPLLQKIVNFLNKKTLYQILFVILSFAVLTLNDLTQNKMAVFSQYDFTGLIPASIQIIWGNIIYKHKDNLLLKIKDFNLSLILCPLLFALTNLVRTFTMNATGAETPLLYWFSSFGIICAFCVVVFALSLEDIFNKFKKLSNVIALLGALTFPVYLLHYPLARLLESYDLLYKFYTFLCKTIPWSPNLVEVIYTVAMTLFVFILTAILCLLLKKLKILFFKLIKH